jgi:hypothetical protein
MQYVEQIRVDMTDGKLEFIRATRSRCRQLHALTLLSPVLEVPVSTEQTDRKAKELARTFWKTEKSFTLPEI